MKQKKVPKQVKLVGVKDAPKEFHQACQATLLQPTRRQFKKWQRKVGQAWRYHVNHAIHT